MPPDRHDPSRAVRIVGDAEYSSSESGDRWHEEEVRRTMPIGFLIEARRAFADAYLPGCASPNVDAQAQRAKRDRRSAENARPVEARSFGKGYQEHADHKT